MSFFKKKLPASTLAMFLMDYTLTGQINSGDALSFALGPRGFSESDGSNVLPEGVERMCRGHLSSRDSFIISLESMYLRGFVVWIFTGTLIKNKRVRESVRKSYEEYWTNWSKDDPLDYKNFYDMSVQAYGGLIYIIRDLETSIGDDKLHSEEQATKDTVVRVGVEFSNMCDPYEIIRDPLKSELARKGENIFTEASESISNLLEGILKIYKVVIT
jgi:hypothetical protein